MRTVSSSLLLYLVVLVVVNVKVSVSHSNHHHHDHHHHHHHQYHVRHLNEDEDDEELLASFCGTETNLTEVLFSVEKDIETYGKSVDNFTPEDGAELVQSLDGTRRRDLQASGIIAGSAYNLLDIPIVYHILPDTLDSRPGVSATEAQLRYMTDIATRSFKIYDKIGKVSVQWATFKYDTRIVHEGYQSSSCEFLLSSEIEQIVTTVDDWPFKLHVLVCDRGDGYLGKGTFPWFFSDADPRDNLLWMNYDVITCRDDEGNFLCDPTDGEEVSNTLIVTSESKVFVHELGHNFGLLHTFEDFLTGDCDMTSNDYIADTPAENHANFNRDCPGLLPYDRDRDLFNEAFKLVKNTGGDALSCRGEDKVCPDTSCAACLCEDFGCDVVAKVFQTEDESNAPYCCSADLSNDLPYDTCTDQPGIDARNNFMTYAWDWCYEEFTPGQMARMMSQVRSFKRYLYCNYADTYDPTCDDVPCSKDATSPNCIDKCHLATRLFNTDYDMPLKLLDDKIDLCLYGGAHFSIEGVAPCASKVKLRLFDENMYLLRKNIEKVRPYTLGDDIDATGNLLPVEELQNRGNYTVELKQANSRNRLTKSFEVDYFCGCGTEFVLWDAARDVPIGPLDDYIDLCYFESSQLSIQVVARCESEPVTLSLVEDFGPYDDVLVSTVQSTAPYMLGGRTEGTEEETADILPVFFLTELGIYTIVVETSSGVIAKTIWWADYWTCPGGFISE